MITYDKTPDNSIVAIVHGATIVTPVMFSRALMHFFRSVLELERGAMEQFDQVTMSLLDRGRADYTQNIYASLLDITVISTFDITRFPPTVDVTRCEKVSSWLIPKIERHFFKLYEEQQAIGRPYVF